MHDETQIAYLLRQGRKLGFAGWFSTQWLNTESSKNALGDIQKRLYFAPARENRPEVAQDIADVTSNSIQATTKAEYRGILTRLSVGQFVYVDDKHVILSNDPEVGSTDFSLEDIIF